MPSFRYIVLLSLALSGCASLRVSQPPPGPESATVVGSVRQALLGANTDTFLIAVDGVKLPEPILRADHLRPVPVQEGERVFELGYTRVVSGGSYFASATLKATVVRHRSYTVVAREEGEYVYLWIEDAAGGQRISAEAMATRRKRERHPLLGVLDPRGPTSHQSHRPRAAVAHL